MKYLPTQKGNAYDSFAVNAAIELAITSLISLFAALIAIGGPLGDSGPSGHGKTTYGDDEDALKYLNKFN